MAEMLPRLAKAVFIAPASLGVGLDGGQGCAKDNSVPSRNFAATWWVLHAAWLGGVYDGGLLVDCAIRGRLKLGGAGGHGARALSTNQKQRTSNRAKRDVANQHACITFFAINIYTWHIARHGIGCTKDTDMSCGTLVSTHV
jgi:hypothetical protein